MTTTLEEYEKRIVKHDPSGVTATNLGLLSPEEKADYFAKRREKREKEREELGEELRGALGLIEQDELKERFTKRTEYLKNNQHFLAELAYRKGKGIRARGWFVNYINCGNRLFPTEEEEYRYINKWGRGQWEMVTVKGFLTKEELKSLWYLGNEFGAMDY